MVGQMVARHGENERPVGSLTTDLPYLVAGPLTLTPAHTHLLYRYLPTEYLTYLPSLTDLPLPVCKGSTGFTVLLHQHAEACIIVQTELPKPRAPNVPTAYCLCLLLVPSLLCLFFFLL
jgi:hypothetical protein